MSLKMSRTVLPFLVLGAASVAGCQLEVSLDGLDPTTTVSSSVVGSSSSVGSGGSVTSVGSGVFVGSSTSVGSVTSVGSGVFGEGGGGFGGDGGSGGLGGDGGSGGGWDPPQFTPDKVDLLFVVDNSGSMADKQQMLRSAAADLVFDIANPRCVDGAGHPVAATEQPASGLEPCPEGTSRARTPVNDMHIGVISTSLGGHGASTCAPTTSASNTDMAHLLARSDPGVVGNDLPTYLDKGFLVWDAAGSRTPAGDSDPAALAGKLGNIIQGVGQAGCGFEAPLESFYRFLVDPEPYQTITLDDDSAVPAGIDVTVLQQRKDFLRSDSLLVIVMLSDENDCSIRDGGRNYLVAETRNNFRLWRPRSECATNPNDPCCRSCAQSQDGCPADPTCTGPDGNPARLSAAEDPVNLRCWDQKRRFGYDFLYPIERYTEALTSPTVWTRNGDVVPNPIFSDLDPEDGNTRTRGPQHVVFTGIVGVPWQDLARQNANGVPDLVGGLDGEGNPIGGLKDAGELGGPVSGGFDSTWEVVLGDPANHVAPADPFMIESRAPRAGANPITGDGIVQPHQTGWNAINGREYTIPSGSSGDLQYACIFDVEERSCEGTTASCECRMFAGNVIDNPVCMPEGTNDPAEPLPRTTTQYKGKAYPGLRELQLLQSLGTQAVAGSICPAQTADTSSPDYGYLPVMRAVLDRLDAAL
ncbi:hypothetical protein [Sorangium sp. So ce406]|uniref:hypothetical protein n=1 Tax=Sorangium sp. So ce406 TaxID=3133311 RepID=UPI003F5C1383